MRTEKKRVKVRYLGKDDPMALRHGKVYDAIVGDLGWYCIVDETHEEYAYPPKSFELVQEDE